MPVGFLSDEQANRYGRFLGDPTQDQLARHFHLDDADRAFVGEHRGNHNRLGVAVQLGSIRLLGTFLEDPALTPASVVRFAGDQLAMAGSAELMAMYVASAGRWRHGPRIRERYGYRLLTDFGVFFRLHRFLYALCWTGTDRPSTLFERAVAWLQAAKVVLPGISVLERAVARVRSRTHAYLHRRLTETLTAEQRERLDRLVTVPANERQSPLDRLRDGPYVQSGPEIGRAIARLTEIRAIAEGLPELDRVPPGKAAALARFASAARAQAVSRLPNDRRASTLARSSAPSKRAPVTMSSTCSTRYRRPCSRAPRQFREKRGCGRSAISTPPRSNFAMPARCCWTKPPLTPTFARPSSQWSIE